MPPAWLLQQCPRPSASPVVVAVTVRCSSSPTARPDNTFAYHSAFPACSQVSTINKCRCSNTWEYGGETYSGTCRTGLLANTNAPGITADTNWCFVDKQCSKGKHIDGYVYDLCTPAGGRVTENGDACQFPTTYHGVQLYDCISYNHSTPGVETSKPWCFTNAATGDWGYCAPWTCTAALKANCPAGSPDVNNDLTGWAFPDCLETLCNARKDLANVSLCTQDTDGDRTLLTTAYNTLASSTQFGQLLINTRSAGEQAAPDPAWLMGQGPCLHQSAPARLLDMCVV